MKEHQLLAKKPSKLSLYRNYKSNTKPKNMPPGLKSILITNSNGLDISSQLGSFLHFSKKNMLEENNSIKQITTNYNKNSLNKNMSFPIKTASNTKNIKPREIQIINLKSNLYKKKFEKYLTNSKNNNSINNLNSILHNKSNIRLNIIPKKNNFNYSNFKENNLSLNLNSNKNIGKSISKSKSKNKKKRKNKSYNSNFTKIFFDKYLKLKFDKINYNKKKSHKKNSNNIINKESPNKYHDNKLSNEINISDMHKLNSYNIIKSIQFKGLKKKNKSSNLLISNINNNNQKNINNQKANNIFISKIETNSNLKLNSKNNNNNKLNNNTNNNKVNHNKNGKKYITENHIMYIVNKKNSSHNNNINNNINKNSKKSSNVKTKQVSLKEIKNENNININNNPINNIINNKSNKQKIETAEKVIYDYKTNKRLQKNNLNLNLINKNILSQKDNKILINNTNTNPNKSNDINELIENSVNTYKIMNERLKTEYNDINDISLEAIDKMYEKEENEKCKKNDKFILDDSFKFFYHLGGGDVYNRDDEFFIENNDDNNEESKKEKELDETESPLKFDTDKVSVENSGVLSFDQVKDIICYFNMNNTDKQSEFLFQNKEREIFEINYKNKYLNFFFSDKEVKDIEIYKENNNINCNDLTDDLYSMNTVNFKFPNNSIFSMDTEYSSKMKKKCNKNLVKNI